VPQNFGGGGGGTQPKRYPGTYFTIISWHMVWKREIFIFWSGNPETEFKFNFYALQAVLRIRIRDLFDLYPGSGMEKFRPGLRHKHPGSATLCTGNRKSRSIFFVLCLAVVIDDFFTKFDKKPQNIK
jgi:hypothetical protein